MGTLDPPPRSNPTALIDMHITGRCTPSAVPLEPGAVARQWRQAICQPPRRNSSLARSHVARFCGWPGVTSRPPFLLLYISIHRHRSPKTALPCTFNQPSKPSCSPGTCLVCPPSSHSRPSYRNTLAQEPPSVRVHVRGAVRRVDLWLVKRMRRSFKASPTLGVAQLSVRRRGSGRGGRGKCRRVVSAQCPSAKRPATQRRGVQSLEHAVRPHNTGVAHIGWPLAVAIKDLPRLLMLVCLPLCVGQAMRRGLLEAESKRQIASAEWDGDAVALPAG